MNTPQCKVNHTYPEKRGRFSPPFRVDSGQVFTFNSLFIVALPFFRKNAKYKIPPLFFFFFIDDTFLVLLGFIFNIIILASLYGRLTGFCGGDK